MQLVSNGVDQLEMMKCKTLQKENDQLPKEKDSLRRIYDELKSSVGFMEENWLSLFTGLKFFPFLDKIMWFFKYLTPGDLNYYFLKTIEFL